MKSNQIEFYIGGCRSGKSRAALERAENLGADRRIYIATCRPADDEMRARVARHQAERGASWETLEEPVEIARLIREHCRPGTVVLLDCLTLWLTNLIVGGADDNAVQRQIEDLTAALMQSKAPILLVANEVGLGIVPENALSRRFRDWAGILNQEVARCAGTVFLLVAGIPLVIKPPALDTRHP